MFRPHRHTVGFTLIEILVAVAVLVVVILIAGQAFQAASSVARQGEASGDVLQEGWTIKSQIESDLNRISPDGALVIHSVEVPNDFNRRHWTGTGTRPSLINPGLPASAPIRCDQLLFFMSGFEPTKQYGSDLIQGTAVPRALGGSSCITYGHGVQFEELAPYSITTPEPEEVENSLLGALPPQHFGHDVDSQSRRYERQDLQLRLAPFYQHNVNEPGGWGGGGEGLPTKFTGYGFGTSIYGQINGPDIRGDQPEARRWLLARQTIPLGDDDGEPPGGRYYPTDASKRIYRSQTFAAETLFPADPRARNSNDAGFDLHVPVAEYGRVDFASILMGGVREALLHSQSYGAPFSDFRKRPWFSGDVDSSRNHGVLEIVRNGGTPANGTGGLPGGGYQRDLLKSLLAWPRVDRSPAGPARFDQMLATPIMSAGCSSFIVEWTWDEDTGEKRTWQRANVNLPDGRINKVIWNGLRYDASEMRNSDWVALGLDAPPDGTQLSRQRWFGLPSRTDGDGVHPDERDETDPPQFDRRVCTFTSFANHFTPPFDSQNSPRGLFGAPAWKLPEDDKPDLAAPSLVHPDAIDEETGGFGPIEGRVREYWAVFGPNRRWPTIEGLDVVQGGNNPPTGASGADGTDDPDPSYTPWPSALRFTMVLHDPATNLEQGKEIQFIVELPKDRLQ